MRHSKIFFILIAFFNLSAIDFLHAQVCDPNSITGPNLVVNPSFEDGDDGSFYTDIKCSWNAPDCASCRKQNYSQYGEYYIGYTPSEASCNGDKFQKDWHETPNTGSKFLMVDGAGGANDPVVWRQTVTVEANNWYYFETFIITLGIPNNENVAHLKFKIDGVEMDKDIKPDSSQSIWTPYRATWFSGPGDRSITIEIIDTQGNNIARDLDDFGLDDIAFVKGCPPDAYPENPDLGPDLTFCGTNITSFTLDPSVTPTGGQNLTWSTGETTNTIDVSTAGTYYVCFQNPGNCTKYDSIVVSDRFKVDLGSNVELCDPAALTLDAGFTGPGVTYQWFKDKDSLILGKTKTLFVNEGGEYKVVVHDPKCQTEKDSINVTLKAGTPTPNNVRFCLTNNADTTITFSVNPAGTSYEWYDMPTGGTLIGSDTSSITRSGIITGDTLYVQDIATKNLVNQGPQAINTEPSYGVNPINRKFDALTYMTINSIEMAGVAYNGGPCKDKSSGSTSHPFTIELFKDNVTTGIKTTTATVICKENYINPTVLTSVPLNFEIPSGTGYELKIEGGDGWFFKSPDASDRNEILNPGTIKILESPNSGAFFRWDITTKSPCSRIPVMARDICVLPVTFAAIKAIKSDQGVKIFWATASEKDNSHFEIERLINGDWISVGQIPANGNSNDYIQYDFSDIDAPNQVVYYRIKQVDNDGKNSYSEVVSVDNISFYTVIRPNPSNSATFLTIYSSEQLVSKVAIHDAYGRLVEELTVSNNQEYKIGEQYNVGVYIISVWAGPEPEKIKFIRR